MTRPSPTHGPGDAGDARDRQALNIARERIIDATQHSDARLRKACRTVLALAHLIEAEDERARLTTLARRLLPLVTPKGRNAA